MSRLAHLKGPQTGPGVQRVFFATPSYSGSYPDIYTQAMVETVCLLNEQGIGWEWCRLLRNCHVDDARNLLVREFLASGCTDLMFLDADVGWNGREVLRLLRADRDFVCGVYPYRGDDSAYPVRMVPGEVIQEDADGLVTALSVPTGFMRMRRRVLDRMIEAYVSGRC